MVKLIQYYELNSKVLHHIVTFAETEEKMSKVKAEIYEIFKEAGIETLEVIASKNIDSLKEILKRDNIEIFQVIKEE